MSDANDRDAHDCDDPDCQRCNHIGGISEETRKRLSVAWDLIRGEGPGHDEAMRKSRERTLALLASARNEASDLLGLLMATPGFSCGGVTASTIVYTRNGRAFHAVIHDVTDQYGDGKASGLDPNRECACGGRDFQIKSDGPNQAWLKCLRCGERQS